MATEMDKMVQIPAPLQNQNGEDCPWFFRFWGGAGVGWLIEKPPKEGGLRGQTFDIAVNSAVDSDCVAQEKSPAARQQIAFTCFTTHEKTICAQANATQLLRYEMASQFPKFPRKPKV